jgi:hypothetical protein
MSHKLRVERFSTFIILTYSFFITLIALISGLTCINGDLSMLSPFIIGIIIPIVFSAWNCVAINWIGCNKPNIMLEFNLMRFIVNCIFIFFIMSIGINWFSLDVSNFGLILFFTWFTLHMIEAFYSASFIRKLTDDYPNLGSSK